MSALKSSLEEAREEGIEKGMEKGREEGMEKGREEGIEKGMEKAKKDMVLRLLKMGLEVKKILKATGLSQKEIKKLQAS